MPDVGSLALPKSCLKVMSGPPGHPPLVQRVSPRPLSQCPESRGVRDDVRGRSLESVKRLHEALQMRKGAYLRPEFRALWVTRTYGCDVPALARAKVHDERYWRELTRRFAGLGMVWVQEWQRRGAVHFHDLLLVPVSVEDRELVRVMGDLWLRISGDNGSTAEARRAFGVRVRLADMGAATTIGRYMAKVLSREMAKSTQRALEGRWTGRTWGVRGRAVYKPFEASWAILEGNFGDVDQRIDLVNALYCGVLGWPWPAFVHKGQEKVQPRLFFDPGGWAEYVLTGDLGALWAEVNAAQRNRKLRDKRRIVFAGEAAFGDFVSRYLAGEVEGAEREAVSWTSLDARRERFSKWLDEVRSGLGAECFECGDGAGLREDGGGLVCTACGTVYDEASLAE